MTLSYSYVRELELLITDVLLPEYIKSQKAKGNNNPLQGINESLIQQLKAQYKVPALLQPYKNLS
jgi:hypothetical protein